MAIGWLSAFRAIPWSDVISAAPTVAQGAKKLWETVKREEVRPDAAEAAQGGAAPSADRLAELESEVGVLRARLGEAQEQQLAASALVKSLAEQNAQLVSAVEILRMRTRALFGLCGLLALACVVLAAWIAAH